MKTSLIYKMMLIYKINLSLLTYFFVGVPDADRQKYKQTKSRSYAKELANR